MPNYFFELSDDFAKSQFYNKTYLAIYLSKEEYGKIRSIWFTHYMLISDRVWIQDDNGIRFLKNRFISAESEVDLEEFTLIKLKAESQSL